jgi:hypothetical protein
MLDPLNFNSDSTSKPPHHSAKIMKMSTREKQVKQKLVPGTPQKASVEAAISGEEGELGIRKVTVPKPDPIRKVKPKKVIGALKAAASHLANIRSLEDVEVWLEENGINEEESLAVLRNSCKTVADLLSVQNPSTNENSQHVSGTLAHLGQFYIYRNGTKRVELLAPVDVFHAGKNYAAKKGFGFVRRTGSYFPVLYAVSGWADGLQPTSKLLDSRYWTEEVMAFTSHWEIKLRSDGFDVYKGEPFGKSDASHAEKQLMLAYAYRLLHKATGIAPSFKKLQHIRGMNIHKEADIVLNDKPCFGCRSFQKELEFISGIKYNLVEVPSLGNIVPVKNSRGYKTWKTRVQVQIEDRGEEESDEGGVAEAEEEEERCLYAEKLPHRHIGGTQKNRFEIVIPSRAAAHIKETQPVPDSEPESEGEITVQTRVTVSKTKRQINFEEFYHTPPSGKLKPKRQRTYGNDSDEEDWEPPSRSRSRLSNEGGLMTPTKKIVTRNDFATPPESAEFGPHALDYARKVALKRMESTPIQAKKARRYKY